MTVVVQTNNKEKGWIPTLIPERSKAVQAAWLKAEELAQSASSCKTKFLVAAYTAKAIAISFFNTIAYLGLAAYHFLTKTVIHCDGSQGMQDLEDAARSLVLSIIGAAIVTVAFFSPKEVFGANEMPNHSQSAPLPITSQHALIKKPTRESTDDSDLESLPDESTPPDSPRGTPVSSNAPLEDAKKQPMVPYHSLLSYENSPSKPKSPEADSRGESSENPPAKVESQKPERKIFPAARGTEGFCLFSEEFSRSLAAEEGKNANPLPRNPSSNTEKPQVNAQVFPVPGHLEQFFNPAPPSRSLGISQSQEHKKASAVVIEKPIPSAPSVQPAPISRQPQNIPEPSASSQRSKASANPFDAMRSLFSLPQLGSVTSTVSRPVAQTAVPAVENSNQTSSSLFSLPLGEIQPANLAQKPREGNQGQTAPVVPSSQIVDPAPQNWGQSAMNWKPSAKALESSQLSAPVWANVGQYLNVDDRVKLLAMLRAGGSVKATTESIKPQLMKAHFAQKGIELRILKETVVNGVKHYDVMVVFSNIKSENEVKPTREDTNKRVKSLFKDVQNGLRELKEKGLISKNTEINIRSLDCSYSDISMQAIFEIQSNLPKIHHLNMNATRLTVEAFNNLSSLTNLESLSIDFTHGEKARFNRYARRHDGDRWRHRHRFHRETAPTKPETGAEKVKRLEDEDRLVINKIHDAAPCPSVKRVSMIGTVLKGDWFEAITKLFPNAESIDYSIKPSEEGSSLKDRRLDCGHLATKAEAEKAVSQHDCSSGCSHKVASSSNIQPIIRATRTADGWNHVNVVEYGAIVHKNCGMLFNPSAVEKMFDLGEKAKAKKAEKAALAAAKAGAKPAEDKKGAAPSQKPAADFDPLKEAIEKGYPCPHCNDPFTKTNMLPVRK